MSRSRNYSHCQCDISLFLAMTDGLGDWIYRCLFFVRPFVVFCEISLCLTRFHAAVLISVLSLLVPDFISWLLVWRKCSFCFYVVLCDCASQFLLRKRSSFPVMIFNIENKRSLLMIMYKLRGNSSIYLTFFSFKTNGVMFY